MTAYVTTKTTSGKKYLYVIDVSTGPDNKRHQKIIESYGNYEKALSKDPDIVEKLKKKHHCLSNIERAAAAVMQVSEEIALPPPDSQDFSFTFRSDSTAVSLIYGLRALYPIWDGDLKLNYKLNYLQARNSDLKGKLNEIAFYLTARKLIEPVSQYRAYREQNLFLHDPLSEVPLRDLYNTLSFIEDNRSEIMKYLNTRVQDVIGRTMTMVFYDCTNVYFETPYDDKQLLFRQLVKIVKEASEHVGISPEQIDELADDPDVIDRALFRLTQLVSDETCFRMRGLSKEHRYDLPLVSIALVIDTNGIPIDFEVFPGNKSEYHTMPKLIKDMVDKYQIKKTIVVADRGLNSFANLKMLQDAGLGFIVAQKVSNLKGQYEQEMLNLQDGYKPWDSETRLDIEQNAELFDDTGIEADLIYKRCKFKKEGYIMDEQGERKKHQLDCEIMYTYSKKRHERDINQLESDIALARKAVLEKKDMSPTTSAGWRSLVNTRKEVLETEEQKAEAQKEEVIITAESEETENNTEQNKSKKKTGRKKSSAYLYKAESLKEEVIEHRRKLAGFAAIVYKDGSNSTTAMTDDDLMRSYHQLVKIEECFRIMKTNFTVRPVFVRTREHIIGHITLCVIALIISRILELRLERNNHKLSLNEIQEALKSRVTAVSSDGNVGIFLKNTEFRNIYTKENMEASVEDENSVDARELAIKHYIEQNKYHEQAIDVILSTVGLKPLPYICNVTELCKCLKIRGDYPKLVGAANSACQQAEKIRHS